MTDTDLLPIILILDGVHCRAGLRCCRQLKLGILAEAARVTEEGILFIIVDRSLELGRGREGEGGGGREREGEGGRRGGRGSKRQNERKKHMSGNSNPKLLTNLHARRERREEGGEGGGGGGRRRGCEVLSHTCTCDTGRHSLRTSRTLQGGQGQQPGTVGTAGSQSHPER